MSGNSITNGILGLTVFAVGMTIAAAVAPICPVLSVPIGHATQIGAVAVAADGLKALTK